MDYGEIKSVRGAQDVEKAQEPQRPHGTLSGASQTQTPRGEHGGTEGMGWVLGQEPCVAHCASWSWAVSAGGREQGTASPQAFVPEPQGPCGCPGKNSPPGRMVNLAGGQGGHVQSHSLPRGTPHPSNAKHQAGLQKEPGEQALPRDQGA